MNVVIVDGQRRNIVDEVTGALKVKVVNPSGGGGGGGGTVDQGAAGLAAWLVTGAVTVAGVATAAKQDTGNASLASIDGKLPALSGGKVPVDVVFPASQAVTGPLTDAQLRAGAVPVSGAFFQATQPVSAAALPLPAGASTEVTLALIKAKTDNLDVALSTRAVTGLTDAQLRASAVPISAAALPLPAGAATETTLAAASAKLPATLGQKAMAASMAVVLASDQASVPVAATCSGTVTSNIGTTNGLALDATLTGGTQKAITRGGAKGATAAADMTSTAEGADHQAQDVQIYHGGVAKDPTAIRALTSADVVTAAQGTAAAAGAPWAQRLSDGAAFYDAVKTGQLPAALVGGRADVNTGAWLGSTAPTVGSKTSANSVPVVIASDQGALPLPTGAATSAKQDTIIAALPATLGQKAMAAALAVSLASDQSAIPVTAPTITKGTQGANGFTTQDLKDAGRARVSIVFQGTGAVADALLSLVKSTNGTAASGATTIAVAANKRLRITSMTFSVKANAAAAAFATFTLRINPAGAALIGSQSEFRVDLGNTEAVAGAARSICVPVPDGLELTGTEQLAVSAVAQATTNILSVTLTGFEY